MAKSEITVHQMVRGLSKKNFSNPDYNVWTSDEVDRQLTQWKSRGYEVKHITYLGEWDDAFFFHYLLEKVV